MTVSPTRRSGLRRSVPLVALVVLSSLAACNGDDADDSTSPTSSAASTDREAVVGRLVDDVIVPAVTDAASTAAAFDDAVKALCAAPTTDTLNEATATLAIAWSAWELTDSFDIGPVMDRRSASVVAYRVDAAKVDETLAGTPPADPETVRNRTGSSLRGYGAATHLLSGTPAGSEPTTDPVAFADPARCGYLSAVSSVIAEETAVVADGWTDGLDGSPPFRETATGSGDDALTPTDVIDSLVNMQLSQLEAESKLLTAVVQAGPATPIDLPTAELFQLDSQVQGIGKVYGSLSDLLDPKLASRVVDGSEAITEVLRDREAGPLEPQPAKDLVADVQQAVEDLRLTISTEVVSALDVTISFSENDGDS